MMRNAARQDFRFPPVSVINSSPDSGDVQPAALKLNSHLINYAAQTGLGNGFALAPPGTVASGTVIAGQSPSSTNCDFDLEPYWGDRNGKSLTGGSPVAGAQVIYSQTNTSANSYNLTNPTIYGGWKDNSRNQQAYTIYYPKNGS
jgi:hypothetical protein